MPVPKPHVTRSMPPPRRRSGQFGPGQQIRLHEARLLLVVRPDDIAGVAYAVGYDSPSQFSSEFRRRFGTAPSHDATRLRTSIWNRTG